MSSRLRVVTVCMVALTWTFCARATAQEPRVTLGAGGSIGAAGLDTAYRSRYRPAFDGEHSGEAGQRFQFAGRRAEGGWASLVWFAGRFGFEARVDAGRFVANAGSGPYEIAFQYQARQPPDYVPRDYTLMRSGPWGPVEASFHHATVSANAAALVNPRRRVRGTVSGGLSLGAVSGRLAPVGYTTFRLGGHAVLFSEEYGVEVAFVRTMAVGLNAGGDVEIPLSARTAVTLGGRLLALREVRMAARVTRRIEPLDAFTPLSPADIERVLQPPPLALKPTVTAVSAGLRIRF
jgi:hypothetical protein